MKLAVMTRNTALFRSISQCFEADDRQCTRFSNEATFIGALHRDDYHAILIDAQSAVAALRPFPVRGCRHTALIVVGTPEDRASLLELCDAGADDVVLCPFSHWELALRVDLAVRRIQPGDPGDTTERIECGPYGLDRRNRTVSIEGQPVRLSSREFAIAWLVFANPGEYVSRRQIAAAVWSSSENIVGRTLEQHIYKLRKKLGLNGAYGVRLHTMYAHGYRIELDSRSRVAALAGREPDDSAADAARARATTGATRRTEALATAQIDAYPAPSPVHARTAASAPKKRRAPGSAAVTELEQVLASCVAGHGQE